MFLRILNDDQKRALWVIAYHLVVSDHSVSIKEGDLMDELTNGLRTEIPVSPQQLLEKPSLDAFDSREPRVAAMLEILTIALGDNMFPNPESALVANLASDFGFDATEFAAMRAWAVRNSVLLDEADEFMAQP